MRRRAAKHVKQAVDMAGSHFFSSSLTPLIDASRNSMMNAAVLALSRSSMLPKVAAKIDRAPVVIAASLGAPS